MKKIGARKVSADHTFKVMKKCLILNDDKHYVRPYKSLYLVLNEIGMAVSWRFCVDQCIPRDVLEVCSCPSPHFSSLPVALYLPTLRAVTCPPSLRFPVPPPILQELSKRHNIDLEEIYTDKCCEEVNLWGKYFPNAKVLLDLFHAVQRVVREISKKQKGSAIAAKAFGTCFRGEGDKTVTRAENSRTATFDTNKSDNVVTRMRHWKRTFSPLVNQKVSAEIDKLEREHS